MFLVDGIVATGAGAFHAGVAAAGLSQLLPPPSIPASVQAPAASPQSQAASQDNDNDDEAGNTSIEVRHCRLFLSTLLISCFQTLVSSDLTPSSPVTSAVAASSHRKRPVSSSTPSSPSGPRSRRKRNTEAASEIATALRDVAKSLNTMGSPEVRSRAVRMMEEDDEFSEGEEPLVMRLFAKDISVAQTYIASTKKSRRVAFVRAILEDTEL